MNADRAVLAPSNVAELTDGIHVAEGVFESLERLGIDMEDVARVLEEEGVASFSKSFDELIGALERKSAELSAS